MAVKRSPKKTAVKIVEAGEPVEGIETEGALDPKEEKILDWILKGVVAFVLGWLGLSILLVLGGFLGLWK